MNINLDKIPNLPGVYFFKDQNNQILYIGKAKYLKKRVSSYFNPQNIDLKIDAIITESDHLDYVVTKTELEAMLLEAELIKSNQPRYNILLKEGQPFLYLAIIQEGKKLPEFKLVRNKKGEYFGPFLDKKSARKVYDFLIKTFKLKLCYKKIPSGCLDYHLGFCAGICRPDFDKESYLERLNLAKLCLTKDNKNFLKYLKEQIDLHNKKLEFEKSKELYNYYQAFGSVFENLKSNLLEKNFVKDLASKDIWILVNKNFFLFSEKNGHLTKKRIFYLTYDTEQNYKDYFFSYYKTFNCPNNILINFDLEKEEKELFQKFLQKYYKKEHVVSIIKPESGHFYNLLKLAQIQTNQELEKEKNLAKNLKKLFKLNKDIHTLDCFDISTKQGLWQVGSCIRFKDGQPDKDNFRKFKIKLVKKQDDFACLQEIIKRRYKNNKDLPDLILIDGGKGQLSSVTKILNNFPEAQMASLAKKEETIFSKNIPEGKKLNLKNYADQILIKLRGYAHHFAVSYHRKLSKL